jgi:hypothetical protein
MKRQVTDPNEIAPLNATLLAGLRRYLRVNLLESKMPIEEREKSKVAEAMADALKKEEAE